MSSVEPMNYRYKSEMHRFDEKRIDLAGIGFLGTVAVWCFLGLNAIALKVTPIFCVLPCSLAGLSFVVVCVYIAIESRKLKKELVKFANKSAKKEPESPKKGRTKSSLESEENLSYEYFGPESSRNESQRSISEFCKTAKKK